MTGDGLTRFGRAFLHEDTFELVAAPAIADLQFDATPAAYAAACESLTAAFVEDFRSDMRSVTDDLGMLGVLIAIQASYYACMLSLLISGMSATDAFRSLMTGVSPQLLIVVTVLITASTVPTLVCFWPPRRVREFDP